MSIRMTVVVLERRVTWGVRRLPHGERAAPLIIVPSNGPETTDGENVCDVLCAAFMRGEAEHGLSICISCAVEGAAPTVPVCRD